MSRTICAGVLAFSLAALGCGSKPDPQPAPDKPLDPQPPAPKPPDGDKKDALPPIPVPPAPKASWEPDVTKHNIPAQAASGSAGGAEFVPTVALEGGDLTFRTFKGKSPEVERGISLHWKLPPNEKLAVDRKLVYKHDAPADPMQPEIWLEVPGKPITVFPAGYGLTLELGPRSGGKLTGKIYLSLPDETKTFVAGTFTAEIVRAHTERPGPDEVPYVGGEIVVTGAKPESEIRTTYASLAAGNIAFKELQIPFDAMPVELAKWTRDETDKPRVSTLVSGDGKARAFRYEHVKLAPGRYLLSAAVVGGPAVWKWVDVPPNGSIAENFALDATKLGGVEVQVPADAKGKVLLAPADDPAKPALEADLFQALAAQVIRKDAEIVAGRAKVTDLGPGKYEVRAGDLRGFVDVVPGKTVDLVLTPKK